MNTPDPKPSLEQLVEGAAQGMREQQAKAAAQTARQPAPRRGRVVLAGTLALVCAGLLAVQAPRIAAPYEWPDPDRNPVVADADLETMVGLIEAYRLARGRYPRQPGRYQPAARPGRGRRRIQAGVPPGRNQLRTGVDLAALAGQLQQRIRPGQRTATQQDLRG
jgi:hypothetical protein